MSYLSGIAQIMDNSNLGAQSLNTLNNKIRSQLGEKRMITFQSLISEKESLLFSEWPKEASVYLNKKIYILPNINFNISKKLFLTRLDNDSIFVLNSRAFERIIINKKTFKSFQNKVFEIVYEGEKKSILKEYYLKVVEKSKDIMVDRSEEIIKKKSRFFVYRNNILSPLRLRKKDILELFIEKENVSAIKEYMKENQLSFKSEKHLQKILDYNETL